MPHVAELETAVPQPGATRTPEEPPPPDERPARREPARAEERDPVLRGTRHQIDEDDWAI